VDPKALPRSPLAALARENRPGVVQVFYRARGDKADLWVLDERGSLFQQTLAFHTADALISHLGRFLQSVSRRLNQLRGTADPEDGEWTVAFYRVAAGENGEVKLVSREAAGDGVRGYLDLQAIVEQVEGGRTVFSVYCNDEELSSRDHGRNLFAEVANCVRRLRHNGGDYPVYLTDLDLAPAIVGEPPERLQTVHYLFYKQRLESLLNQALEQ
jgi:adenylate cyclase class 1